MEPMSRSAKGFCHGLLRRREDFTGAHALHALPEHVTVDRVAIAEEVGRGGIVLEGVHDLLGRPGSGGMLGDVEVEDGPGRYFGGVIWFAEGWTLRFRGWFCLG